MKIISSKAHGYIDYMFSIFLLAAPTIFGMEGTLSTITYFMGASHLAITALTDFEVGILRVIPFRIHGLLEIFVALLFIGLAFWFYNNESEFGFYFYLALAGVVLIVFVLTDFTQTPESRR